MVYTAFAKPLILNIMAMMPGGIGQTAANTLGGMPGGGAIDFGNLLGMGSMGETVGTAIGNMFGAGSTGGAIGGAIGGALPYVGIAMMVGNLLFGKGGVFDDPDAMRAASFGGAATGLDAWTSSSAFGQFGFSNVEWGSEAEQGPEVRQFLAGIQTMDDALASMMSEEQITRATERLAAFSQRYELGMEHTVTQFGDITQDRLEVIAGAINEGLGAFAEAFDGPVEDLLTIIESYLQATSGGVDFAAMAEAAAPRSQMETYQRGIGLLNEFVAGMDISAESMSQLTQGMAEFQTATVQMILAIDAAAAAIHDMFMSTADQIRMDVMSPEERYAFLQQRAEGNLDQLLTETDPARIQALAESINRDIQAAWGMLDEGQRETLGDAYIERLMEVDALVADKMRGLRDVVIEDANTMMQTIADRLDVLFANAATTAAINQAAANTMLVAAQTPQQVAVAVYDPSVNGG
jgi:hypothetical protein